MQMYFLPLTRLTRTRRIMYIDLHSCGVTLVSLPGFVYFQCYILPQGLYYEPFPISRVFLRSRSPITNKLLVVHFNRGVCLWFAYAPCHLHSLILLSPTTHPVTTSSSSSSSRSSGRSSGRTSSSSSILYQLKVSPHKRHSPHSHYP